MFAMGLSYDEVNQILKLIDESSCDEFVLETEDIKLVVRKHSANGSAPPAPIETQPLRFPSELRASSPTKAASAHDRADAVRAPMVGRFFRSPSPNEPPFVEIGSKVNKGDPICIIEVMKLFTTIHAEWSGTVTEIGAENAKLVEYGQMLFVITPE